MKKRNLERHLREHSCKLPRQASNHELRENEDTRARTTVPRHREIKPPTARDICRQLGIPAPTGSR